jgi:hypothetical protein
LAGLSAITRCGQTPYYDDNITAINFGSSSRFALDGERLININGTYGVDGTEYATENENFTRVVSHGYFEPRIMSTVTLSFTVYTDDGTIIEYGGSDNSRLLVTTMPSRIISWYISKITDANGNYMTYHYKKYGNGNENEIVIDYISYTDNSNITPYAKVQFDYTGLPVNMGSNTYFVRGYGIPQTKLLETITVYYGNTEVRKYKFNYNLNDPEERTAHLKEVVLSDGNNTQLNATTIEWGENNNNLEDKVVPLSGLPEGNIITGDFNGDGYTDYVIYGQGIHKNTWKLYTGSETGVFTPTAIEGTHQAFDEEVECLFYRADITGDGSDNLIIVERSYVDTIRILSLKSGIEEVAKIPVFCFFQLYFGDFNGNGAKDILIVQFDIAAFLIAYNALYKISFYSYSGSYNKPLLTLHTREIPTLCVGDFDGDGKSDILVHYPDKTFYTYSYDLTQKEFVRSNANNFPSFIRQFYTGDFNGDGITDILTYDANETWQIRFGGSNFNPTNIPNLWRASVQGFPYRIPMWKVIIADINGDGKDDIIQLGEDFVLYNGQPTDAYVLRILYSKGCIINPAELYLKSSSGIFN